MLVKGTRTLHKYQLERYKGEETQIKENVRREIAHGMGVEIAKHLTMRETESEAYLLLEGEGMILSIDQYKELVRQIRFLEEAARHTVEALPYDIDKAIATVKAIFNAPDFAVPDKDAIADEVWKMNAPELMRRINEAGKEKEEKATDGDNGK